MSESDRAAMLIDEWKKNDARNAEIKRELAVLLGVAASSTNGTPVGAAAEAPSDDSAIAVGTKSRAALEAIKAHGGQAKAGPVLEAMVSQRLLAANSASKAVRGYFSHLRRKGYLIAVKGQRGVWALTPKARAALGD